MTNSTPPKSMNWDPENSAFWETTGRRIASRNLWCSVPCLFLSFATWVIWSAVTVNLNRIGFHFTPAQLFTLAAAPGLTGASLRILYSFVVPIVGGKNWTVLSTASLLIPTLWLGHAIQDVTTSYQTMLVIAACCGLGGGNFSSSMANISFFFPKKNQGSALGINAGLGNLGVSGLQFMAPLVVSFSLFGVLGGAPQTYAYDGVVKLFWLQNVAYVWVPFIVFFTFAALLTMTNLHTVKTSIKAQLVIFKRKHFYLTTMLYVMSFGSFIGYSVALPLLINLIYPTIDPLTYAFWGPLLGGLLRPVGGWLADKSSGARVTFWSTVLMIGAVCAVYFFTQPAHQHFVWFMISFLLLFVSTGFANGSVFQLIGVNFPPTEKATVLGMTAAIAAFGAFFIPKMFAWSIAKAGTVNYAFGIFLAYYAVCLWVVWWFYCRKSGRV